MSTHFVLLLIIVEVLDQVTPFPLDALGIYPRTLQGLIGIVFSPLLHAGFAHLASNLIPLWILLLLLGSDRRYEPAATLGAIWLVSGFGTWLIGRGGAVHIGASSLVFGLATFLMASVFYRRSWRAIFVALGVFLVFGGMFVGVLPTRAAISWEGHLCGALAGWWRARELATPRRKRPASWEV